MTESLPNIDDKTLQFYSNYCGIDNKKELEDHILWVKQKLVKQGGINYRCIQKYKFSSSRMYQRFFYKDLIELGKKLLQDGQKPYFLDVGCCTGTDLRKLIVDGYPKNYLIGIDVEQSYINCGYALFKDTPVSCPIQFIVDDLLGFEDSHALCNTISIVHAGSVLHLFDLDKITRFLQKAALLLRPGGVLVGGHVCTDKPTEYFRHTTKSVKYFMGTDQFKQLLQDQGFVDVRIEEQLRQPEEDDDEQRDFVSFWISFYAIYDPSQQAL